MGSEFFQSENCRTKASCKTNCKTSGAALEVSSVSLCQKECKRSIYINKNSCKVDFIDINSGNVINKICYCKIGTGFNVGKLFVACNTINVPECP